MTVSKTQSVVGLPYPATLSKKLSKVVEAAVAASATVAANAFIKGTDTVGPADIAANAVVTAGILNANVTLAKLAAGITPSHVIKFVRTGITGSTLAGVAISDICVQWIAASGLINISVAIAGGAVPQTLAPADYVIVLRAAA